MGNEKIPEVEVKPKPRRRRFSADYKLKILVETFVRVVWKRF